MSTESDSERNKTDRVKPEDVQASELVRKRTEAWCTNFGRRLEKWGGSQEQFANELNRRFQNRTSFVQKRISEWKHVWRGDETKDFLPRYEIMVEMAAILGVDVGYLTGETDEESFDLAKATEYLGLEGKAVSSLRRMTRTIDESEFLGDRVEEIAEQEEAKRFTASYLAEKANAEPKACREVLNRMFSAPSFGDFLMSLADVGEREYELMMARVNREYEASSAGGSEFEAEMDAVTWQMLQNRARGRAEERLYEATEVEKAARYRAHELYVRVVDEVFSEYIDADIEKKVEQMSKLPSNIPVRLRD